MRLRRLLAAVLGCVLLASCVTTDYPRVPAYNRYRVEDVLAMAKQGEPPQSIIRKLDQAGAFYPLSASDIVRLHDQGMPMEVLDYMQESYVWKVRREERFQLPQRFSAPY